MELSEQKIDLVKLEEGDWVEKIPEGGNLRLKVRGAENKAWRRMQDKLINAVPRNRRVNGIDPEDRDRITAQLLLNTCLLDWDGLHIDGVPVPYSKEKAKELLTDPQWIVFRNAVSWAANVVATQRHAEIEEDAGN
jgi:hypothetical protein